MNVHAERLIGTLRRECLDHMIVLGEEHAQRTLDEFATYYNEERPHRSLGGRAPVPRSSVTLGEIQVTPHLGGLHHSYNRAA